MKQNYDQNVIKLMYAGESGTGFMDLALTGQLVVRDEPFLKKFAPGTVRVREPNLWNLSYLDIWNKLLWKKKIYS